MLLRHRMDAPASKVWDELADFGGMAHWSPDLAMSTQLARRGVARGAVRELTFARPHAGIRAIRERIIACGDHWFTYVIDGGFGPYPDAGSTWRVTKDGDGCIIEVESHVRGGPVWAMLSTPIVYWRLKRGLRRAFDGLAAHVAR